MAKVQLPVFPAGENVRLVVEQLYKFAREVATHINNTSEGRSSGRSSRATVPVGGTAFKGDIVYNETPTELGSVGAKYILLGWICVVSGTPPTWKEMRVLTGA
jgi:hypothetical protein